MSMMLRKITDKSFTGLAGFSVVLIIMALAVVLGPMIWIGATAVVFKGTVEFRELQYDLHQRGDRGRLKSETSEVEKVRKKIYAQIDQFKRGIDTESLVAESRKKYREYKIFLKSQNLPDEQCDKLEDNAKEIRNTLADVYDSTDKDTIIKTLDELFAAYPAKQFEHTPVAEMLAAAHDYQTVARTIDLSNREKYAESLAEVQERLTKLLGPRPGEDKPALIMEQYGATRWDVAQKQLKMILWIEDWEETEPGKPMTKKLTPRSNQFAGTTLESFFKNLETDLPNLLKPQREFYWQYFIDDSTEGYYYGGVGPEIIGTLLFTVMGMLFAVPIGIISASYLVEYAGDNIIVRTIRICVNTLAGVPSIVFGLFGLVFFVKVLMPALGYESKPCILTGSMTLAILILPVIIRASEEAIRSVPLTYKEASLALGAGKFRTLVKVTLPAALPGILTGIILSLSRAAGETAPLLFAGAIAVGPIPESILEPSRVLSYGSYDIAVGDRYASMVPHKQFGMVVTLIMLVLCLNIVAFVIRSRVSRNLRGQ
ncbi:MAG: phosphate ABC transporter permease PstA [Phycisphaerae bacterium]|nr:phosphate ABC transporter permease PstA [Phycisphaerae bacterium]